MRFVRLGRIEGAIERILNIINIKSPPLWFDPDMPGFRSELRNSTSFGMALLLYSARPELVEGSKSG
jgi:hypothetical protein